MNNHHTSFLKVDDPVSGRKAISEAANVLRRGGLAVFPTETVYGLGANALDGTACTGIFAAKGRPADNPLIVHIARMQDLKPLVREVPDAAVLLAEHFWPGPLTIIMPKSENIPDAVSAGLDTVAVRMPSHPVARALIHEAGLPVAAPSANRSGSPSPTTAQHCLADLDGRVDIILDGGQCSIGVESTVLTLATPVPRLLRPGAVTHEQLCDVLGNVDIDPAVLHDIDAATTPSSPGMKYKHYAPKARIVLVHGTAEKFYNLLSQQEHGTVALAFEEDRQHVDNLGFGFVPYGSEQNHLEQAERLFAALRELDELEARLVFARAPETSGVGLAVYNRLVRAAAFDEVYL